MPYLRISLRIQSVVSRKSASERALQLFCTPFNQRKKPKTPLFDKAEKLEFELAGDTIRGYRWNHPQSRKFLVIHGFQSTATKFERYIKPMINKGYKVLAFDAKAHGDSDGKQVNVLEYKNMIETVHEKYGPIDAFMAHSFGGLALSLALENISHSKQTKLVLIAPATETGTAVDLLFNYLRLNGPIRKDFDELIERLGAKNVSWLSIARAIHHINASVLWIHDEDDDVTPLKDVAPVIKAGYPNIQFMITRFRKKKSLYLCGNSLGLPSTNVKTDIDQELSNWKNLAINGYLHAKNPCLLYQHHFKKPLSLLVGCSEDELTVMNALTVNLHLLMFSFYRPSGKRFKILMEAGAFPSDQYSIETQVRFHGFDPAEAIIEIAPIDNEKLLRTENIISAIEKNAYSIALVLFGGLNYYTGQFYDLKAITDAAHHAGALAGFDFAHAAGNVPLQLHDWQVDFAAWCSYKYLNAGPGSVGGVYIHEK